MKKHEKFELDGSLTLPVSLHLIESFIWDLEFAQQLGLALFSVCIMRCNCLQSANKKVIKAILQ